jgi:glycosyltransferase involved in cell wall biosynthesis
MEPRRISSKSLADMIEQIINNYNNLTNLRENARIKVLSNFTADRYSNKIVEIYHSVLKV